MTAVDRAADALVDWRQSAIEHDLDRSAGKPPRPRDRHPIAIERPCPEVRIEALDEPIRVEESAIRVRAHDWLQVNDLVRREQIRGPDHQGAFGDNVVQAQMLA